MKRVRKDGMTMEDEVRVKSLKKALDILDCFSLEQPELGISEISRMLGLNKSNVYNIVSTFEACGYMRQDRLTGRYSLGLKVMQLSHVVSRSMSFQNVIHKCVMELVSDIDEIIYFGIPDGENVMYMDAGFPAKAYNIRWVQGMTAPMVCTSIGKALLAYQQEEFIDDMLSKPLEKHTEYTITDPGDLRKQLCLIKERGYSIDDMEHEYGVKCVGVPVWDRNHMLIGALSTTGPSLRFDDDSIVRYAGILRKKAFEIQQLL